MPRGQPKNLKPQAHKLTVEEASKGGKKSAEVRKAKKTIKTLLNDYLDSDCKSQPQFKKLLKQLGLEDDATIKQLAVVTCVLNTIKKGELKDLELLQTMLEEHQQAEDTVKVIIDV